MPERIRSCGVLSAPAATTTAPACTVRRSPASSTYSTPVASEPSVSTPLDRGVRAQLQDPAGQRVRDVRVHRRLAGVRGAALDAGAAARAVRIRVRVDGLELGAERAKARPRPCTRSSPSRSARERRAPAPRGRSTARDRRRRTARSRRSSVPIAGCHFATSRSWARKATFVLIVVVPPTQRPATNVTSSPFGRGAKRSGQKRSCAAFDSQRVKSAARRCGPHSSSSTSRPRCASSPAMTPPPAPDPTTTTSNRSFTRSPGTTSPSRGGSPSAS